MAYLDRKEETIFPDCLDTEIKDKVFKDNDKEQEV